MGLPAIDPRKYAESLEKGGLTHAGAAEFSETLVFAFKEASRRSSKDLENLKKDIKQEIKEQVHDKHDLLLERCATKEQVQSLTNDTQKQIFEFREEIKDDITKLREETKADITKLREETKADIFVLKEAILNTQSDVKELRSEMNQNQAKTQSDIKELRSEMKQNQEKLWSGMKQNQEKLWSELEKNREVMQSEMKHYFYRSVASLTAIGAGLVGIAKYVF